MKIGHLAVLNQLYDHQVTANLFAQSQIAYLIFALPPRRLSNMYTAALPVHVNQWLQRHYGPTPAACSNSLQHALRLRRFQKPKANQVGSTAEVGARPLRRELGSQPSWINSSPKAAWKAWLFFRVFEVVMERWWGTLFGHSMPQFCTCTK